LLRLKVAGLFTTFRTVARPALYQGPGSYRASARLVSNRNPMIFESLAAKVEAMVGLSPSSSVRFCPAFVPTKEEARRPVADEQTNFSDRTLLHRAGTDIP